MSTPHHGWRNQAVDSKANHDADITPDPWSTMTIEPVEWCPPPGTRAPPNEQKLPSPIVAFLSAQLQTISSVVITLQNFKQPWRSFSHHQHQTPRISAKGSAGFRASAPALPRPRRQLRDARFVRPRHRKTHPVSHPKHLTCAAHAKVSNRRERSQALPKPHLPRCSRFKNTSQTTTTKLCAQESPRSSLTNASLLP